MCSLEAETNVVPLLEVLLYLQSIQSMLTVLLDNSSGFREVNVNPAVVFRPTEAAQ